MIQSVEERRREIDALLWTFTGLRVVTTRFVPTPEGEYRLTFEDGRTLVFTAVGDDMTFCSMDVEREEKPDEEA